MRIADLSRETGVSIPTIKYYLREGLLPQGVRTSRNQAQYDQQHVRRLRLIRALIDYGELPVATIKELLARIDDPALTLHKALGHAQYALVNQYAPPPKADPEVRARAVARATELVERHGLLTFEEKCEENPSFETVVGVLALLEELGHENILPHLDEYAAAAKRIAATDVAVVMEVPELDTKLETVVVGTLLMETLVRAMRLMAQATISLEALQGLEGGGAAPSGD